jgi:hypothetical protein
VDAGSSISFESLAGLEAGSEKAAIAFVFEVVGAFQPGRLPIINFIAAEDVEDDEAELGLEEVFDSKNEERELLATFDPCFPDIAENSLKKLRKINFVN